MKLVNMKKDKVDYSLYFCTDESYLKDISLEECITEVIRAGVSVIQLRFKEDSTKDFLDKAFRIKEICVKNNVVLLVNDRVDIALAINADGVHLGQDDMPYEMARKLLGANKIIGISASTYEETITIQKQGADYIGLGAMYQTPTKEDAKIVSNQDYQKIINEIEIPLVLIGGLNENNINKFLVDKAVSGIVLISALIKDDLKIYENTKKIRNIIDERVN